MTNDKTRAFLKEMTEEALVNARHWKQFGKVCAGLAALTEVYPSWVEAMSEEESIDTIRVAQKRIKAMRKLLLNALTEMYLVAELEIRERKGEHQ
jgi:hypothetical protein